MTEFHETSKKTSDEASDDIGRLCAHEDQPTILQHKKSRGGDKRKRDNNTAESMAERLSKFRNSPNYLRIPASSVSALCGLHPFQNLPQLLFDFVYQSYLGQMLLQKDARALGLTLVDAKNHERETMLNLASAASKETKELVKQVLEVSEGKRKLQSVDEVQSIQKQIKSQAVKAQKSGKLSKNQVESLVEASRGHVSTGFGTCHEDEALDVYEQRTGCNVRERNEALMEWRFERVHDIDSELGVTAVPMGDAKRRTWEQLSGDSKVEPEKTEQDAGTEAKPIEIDDSSRSDSTNNSKVAIKGNDISEEKVKKKPFFKIVGAVDGMRDELYMDPSKIPAVKSAASVPSINGNTTISSNASDTLNDAKDGNRERNNAQDEYNFSDDEEEQLALRPIIVECKHRMKEAKVPPPLYDQIQTCLYCHMYNVEAADLIQVVRRKHKKCEEKENNTQNKNKNNDEQGDVGVKGMKSKKEEMKITITRISLNDPTHNHNHHWKATLLPRLASFADAVYNVRKDDGKRYRLLMAFVQSQHEESTNVAEEETWKLLWEECPWIRHCDTAFGKRRMFR